MKNETDQSHLDDTATYEFIGTDSAFLSSSSWIKSERMLPKISTSGNKLTASTSTFVNERRYLPLDFDEVKYLKTILANKVRKPEKKRLRAKKGRTSSVASFESDSSSSTLSSATVLSALPAVARDKSLNNPKLGSMNEKLGDCWQDDFERW